MEAWLQAVRRQPQRVVWAPAEEGVTRRVRPWLKQQGLTLPATVDASSTAHVAKVVAETPGCVGFSVDVSSLAEPGVRFLRLPVDPLLVGAIWVGSASVRLRAMLRLLAEAAKEVR